MKLEAKVVVLSVRPYSFPDRDTRQPVEMTEVVFKDEQGQIYKTSKRGIADIREGEYEITINVIPGEYLKPKLGVIEF